MSEVFEKALGFTLSYEGSKFTNDPVDVGGATKYGITLGFAKGTKDIQIFDTDDDGDIDIIDIKNLSEDQAHDAYKKYFWDSQNLDDYNPKIAFLMFDMGVNHGKFNANKMLQMAICNCGHKIDVDGKIGNETRGRLALCDTNKLAIELINVRRNFYKKLVAHKPALNKFIKGWLNRCEKTEKAINSF